MKRTGLGDKKQWILIGTTIIAVIVCALFFLPKAKSQAGGENPKRKEMKPQVSVQTIQRKDLLGQVLLVGQTVPAYQVDVAAKYSGRVVSVNVDLGQKVSQGQALVVQDTEDTNHAIAQANADKVQVQADTNATKASFYASYQKAQADYQRSLTNYQRYKTLFASGAVSQDSLDSAKQQLDDSKSQLDTLRNQGGNIPASIESKKAQVVKAEAYIAALEKQQADLTLRAPRKGVITYRQVEVGALVQPGQQLLTIVDNSQMYVDCQLSEQDVAHLSIGAKANVEIESLGKNYPGKIAFINPAGDSKVQTFSVRIALSHPDDLLKAGMFARSKVDVLLRPNTLSVPKEAIQEQNGKYYVFVFNKNTVRKQMVQLGLDNDSEYEVLKGIKEGDRVVTSNLARLKSGMKVNLRQGKKQEGQQ